jgi:hypothetical protein
VEVNQAQVEKPKTTLPDAGMGGMTLDITDFLVGALILMLIFARVRRTVKK